MNKKITFTALVLLVAVVAVAVAVYWMLREPDSGSKVPEVPLGVEHAVTITYSGPELIVKPYKFGVPVNLRIANITEIDGARTYDVRYMLNTGGEFDITKFLGAKDGSALDDLPQFKVIGLEYMSQQMDQRIEQVEETGIDIWHYYYECLGAIIILWVIWLLLLIFWGREKPERIAEPAPAETFYDKLRGFLNQIDQKSIDEKGKAQLEMLLINWWRDQLGYTELEMHQVMRQIGNDAASASAFNLVQQWLHNPDHSVSIEELVQSLRPLSVKSENPTT
jgi:hypothetical protein